MRHFREKIYKKLYSMASILLDNVYVPGQPDQEGSDSVVASYFDEDGNKYIFTLSLNVIPMGETVYEPSEPITIPEQIEALSSKMALLENDVNILKGYHNTEVASDPQSDTDAETTG